MFITTVLFLPVGLQALLSLPLQIHLTSLCSSGSTWTAGKQNKKITLVHSRLYFACFCLMG